MFNWRIKKNRIDPKTHQLGKDVELDRSLLLQECETYLKDFDRQLINKAYNWCIKTHKNKSRKSGHPYYTHPLEVALIVIREMPLDDISVAAALLHNVIDEGDTFGLKDIHNEFGSTVAEIVENVVKIKFVENRNINKLDGNTDLDELQSIVNSIELENYRKLLLSMFKDVRIILIKLADRLHNLRTLEFLRPDKQKKMAEETIEVYGPFANRFGLGNLKWELEDLSFKYIDRDAYYEIRNALQLSRQEREQYIEDIVEPLKSLIKKNELISKNNIDFEIFGRAKHIFSIYNKMRIRKLPLSKLYDLFAVRIILDTEQSHFCLLVYSIISEVYKPVPNTFKDYISNPKNNGYQSIHFAVFGPEERPVEIQIRTRSMHLVAEKGVAAHFKYKRGLIPAQSIMDQSNIQDWTSLVREIFEHHDQDDPSKLMEAVRANLLIDEIYVFTPHNDFRVLPKDSTPVDFAYMIHTEIGDRCVGAKINGKIGPLDQKLESGDVVEILTSDNQSPSENWLDFVITQRAKTHISKYIKEERQKAIETGKGIWYEVKNEVGYQGDEIKMLDDIRKLRFNDLDDFFLSIGKERYNYRFLIKFFEERENDRRNGKVLSKLINDDSIPSLINNSDNIKLNSLKNNIKRNNVKVRFAGCCDPLPGDTISASIDGVNHIIVHRSECPELIQLSQNKRYTIIGITWDSLKPINLNTKLKITANENSEIFNSIAIQLLEYKDIELKGLSLNDTESGQEGILSLTLKNSENPDNLKEIISGLSSIEGIKSIERH